ESALKGGDHGPALVPGRADDSHVYRRIAGLDLPAMPMTGSLTAEQIAIVKTWIDEGAHWELPTATAATAPAAAPPRAAALAARGPMEIPAAARDYWAFKLPVQAPLPDGSAFTNPIDRFLEKTRREKGLTRAPRASRLTLLRRAYLDLLGLLPTPAQTD